MKKLFISQPMKGKSDEDILAERQKAIKSAEEKIGEPVEVIDSFFQEAPVDAKPLWFIGKSLELLAGADIAYFAKGWQEAKGCKIENTCAIEYGIPVIEDYTAAKDRADPAMSDPWVKWYLPRIGP
jgi:hypothetical protein